ncbi:MAG: SIS domain-containing protein, partial [Solirubrobacterales bacterium]
MTITISVVTAPTIVGEAASDWSGPRPLIRPASRSSGGASQCPSSPRASASEEKVEEVLGRSGGAAARLAAAERVFVVGIGTSYHAALVGEWLLSAAGADARAVMSVDFALYPEASRVGPKDAVVVMAHSGVKRFSTDSIARAAEAGAAVLSVGSLTA